jgi:hypothetical protein
MSDELQALKDVASHPAAGGSVVIAVFAWLSNKVWRGHRHEVAGMKQVSANNTEVIRLLDEKLDAHSQRDHDVHTELLQTIARNHSEVLEHLINLKR